MRLEHLCDLKAAYRAEPPLVLVRAFGTDEGAAYGEGDGTLTGEKLRGHMHWVNHPHARSDGVFLPDLHGLITTDDDAHILVTLQGRTVFGANGAGDQLTRVIFQTEDDRYRWLNNTFCVYEGVIKEGAGHGHVYLCVNELL